MLKHSFSTLAIAVITTGLASAQNDECATAAPITLGMTAFDTSNATLSAEIWPCAANGGPDLWYAYTATSTDDITISTCGSSYDTALETFSGTCAALVPDQCNDDSCGLQSSITVTGLNTGDVITFRVGGWNGNFGAGTITVEGPPPPPPMNCAQTLFAANNGGNVGGGVYFDITVTQNISIAGLLANTSVNGAAVGMTVYTIAGTYVGNEGNMAAWTMVAEDDGLSIGLGQNGMTPLNFVTPFSLAPGSYGIALIGDNFTTGSQMDHDYTNGTGTNQQAVSGDGVITLDLGMASNAGFTAPFFNPRVWNGEICSSGPIAPGTNYCGPAVVNSTGNSAEISATGSSNVAANDLVLEASNLPANSFAFFLTSQAQGLVMNPGGSTGNLCLGGAIGRYVGAGQIQQASAAGTVSLALDNSMQPTPTGLVQVNAGETWNYTTWFRDMPSTSNFSDGYSVNHN